MSVPHHQRPVSFLKRFPVSVLKRTVSLFIWTSILPQHEPNTEHAVCTFELRFMKKMSLRIDRMRRNVLIGPDSEAQPLSDIS